MTWQDLDLRHYAAHEREIDRAVYAQSVSMKPRGFWVSVTGEDDWPSWCRGEDFHIERLRVEHRVTLHSDANVLELGSSAQLEDFTEQHGKALVGSRSNHHDYIDWPEVTALYDGIIIAPYVWPSRLDLIWYYGWDCASGCIWNLSAVESLTVLSKEDA